MHYSSSVDAQTSSLRGARWVVGDWTRRSMHVRLAGLAVVFTFILVDVFRVTFGGRTGGLDGLFGFFLFPFHNSLFSVLPFYLSTPTVRMPNSQQPIPTLEVPTPSHIEFISIPHPLPTHPFSLSAKRTTTIYIRPFYTHIRTRTISYLLFFYHLH